MLRSLRIENFVLIRQAEVSFAAGVNAITGETGAGKTILAQAIGLLLGARGDASYVGPGAEEAYVEAEFDLPSGILEQVGLEAIAELRPEDEDGLVAARRVFVDGRTRAYAWGRSVPREELAALVERLLAMSGQFEQRRLARPSFQLDVLDAFIGEEQLRVRADLARAWRSYVAARRTRDELARDAAGHAARIAELRELVARTDGFDLGMEKALQSERERLRHVTELGAGAVAAAEALAPELSDGAGAAELTSRARAAVAQVAPIAPELGPVESDLADSEVRLREAVSTLRAFLASLAAEPERLEEVESELERIGDAKRRFGAASYDELLGRAASARAELERLDADADPAGAAARALGAAQDRVDELAAALTAARREAAPRFIGEVTTALAELAMGGGDFRVEITQREPSASGSDEIAFLIRPNPGLPFAPVAETASGGELSRIALALRTVAHTGAGEPTIVFDEIDAGIGGETAHAVADALRSLGERAQVVTITHLPQIASVADAHFRVEKVPGDPTHTQIEPLADDERRRELERMLGGAEFLSTLR
ncbi:MAG: DNA repair protein RecN [Actinomycetota bacterium]|nr:DNA repair protein RecN [Actinomycetota bacterium]